MRLRIILVKFCAECGGLIIKPPTLSRAAWPRRRYCSPACKHEAQRGKVNPKTVAALRGRKLSPEHRAKLSASFRAAHAAGRMHVIDNTGLRKDQTSQWKGDGIGYRAAHWRLRSDRGKPTACEFCGKSSIEGWIEWALKRDATVFKVQRGLKYSPHPEDYIALCRPCHRTYDARARDPETGRYL